MMQRKSKIVNRILEYVPNPIFLEEVETIILFIPTTLNLRGNHFSTSIPSYVLFHLIINKYNHQNRTNHESKNSESPLHDAGETRNKLAHSTACNGALFLAELRITALKLIALF